MLILLGITVIKVLCSLLYVIKMRLGPGTHHTSTESPGDPYKLGKYDLTNTTFFNLSLNLCFLTIWWQPWPWPLVATLTLTFIKTWKLYIATCFMVYGKTVVIIAICQQTCYNQFVWKTYTLHMSDFTQGLLEEFEWWTMDNLEAWNVYYSLLINILTKTTTTTMSSQQ